MKIYLGLICFVLFSCNLKQEGTSVTNEVNKNMYLFEIKDNRYKISYKVPNDFKKEYRGLGITCFGPYCLKDSTGQNTIFLNFDYGGDDLKTTFEQFRSYIAVQYPDSTLYYFNSGIQKNKTTDICFFEAISTFNPKNAKRYSLEIVCVLDDQYECILQVKLTYEFYQKNKELIQEIINSFQFHGINQEGKIWGLLG